MLSNARPKYNVNKVLRWVFCYVGNKLLISPVEKGIFCPKTAKFGSKLAFLVNLGQGMHLVPCWCVGWWLWRAGCISQDTYLLYVKFMSHPPASGKHISRSLKAVLILLAQILGPPRRRVNFDMFKKHQKCVLCILTPNHLTKINFCCPTVFYSINKAASVSSGIY